MIYIFIILRDICKYNMYKIELSRGDAVVKIRANGSRKFPLRLK